MQSIPVDAGRLGVLRCVGAAEPKLVSAATGEVKRDREGIPVFTVPVALKQEGRRAELIEISVSGEPVGLVEGGLVQVVGLEAFVWEMGERRGVTWRAAAVTPAPAPSGGRRSGEAG